MRDKPFSDEIRELIRQSGRTVHAISKEMGLAASTVHRFMHGSGLSTATLDRLAEVLDLHAVKGKRRKAK